MADIRRLPAVVAGELLDTIRVSSGAVYGLTVLRDELYIARDRSNIIEVFDVATPLTSSCQRRLAVRVASLPQQVHFAAKLLVSTVCIPDATTLQSYSFKTFATHLPAFTTPSRSRATFLLTRGGPQRGTLCLQTFVLSGT